MCIGGANPNLNPPGLPPAVAPPPQLEEPRVREALERNRAVAAAAGGRPSTILTGPAGLEEDQPSRRKTLLGE